MLVDDDVAGQEHAKLGLGLERLVGGRHANRLEALAKGARAKRLGLWGACPRTLYDPYHAVETRR